MYDVCIVGGGAAGMAAAITAARKSPQMKIVIIEKNNNVGRKLLATGNGRCNITNMNCKLAPQIISFLGSIGVLTRKEDGERVYPYSERAEDVVTAIIRVIGNLKIEIKCGQGVEKIEKIITDGESDKEVFKITFGGKILTAQKVLLSTGGKAAPQFGTTGDGYVIAKKLGHKVSKLVPVLTFLELETTENDSRGISPGFMSTLKGIRAKGRASLYKDNILIAEEKGEIQFNQLGLSGICIFNLSRFIKLGENGNMRSEFNRYAVSIDFMPEYSIWDIKEILEAKKRVEGICAKELIRTIIDEKIAMDIIGRAGIDENTSAITLEETELYAIAGYLKDWKNTISGAGGWKNAQCTAGGILLDEIDMSVMKSKIVSNLYFAGEVIDYDGPCGGYNLQNAWETGIKAGTALAEENK